MFDVEIVRFIRLMLKSCGGAHSYKFFGVEGVLPDDVCRTTLAVITSTDKVRSGCAKCTKTIVTFLQHLYVSYVKSFSLIKLKNRCDYSADQTQFEPQRHREILLDNCYGSPCLCGETWPVLHR